MRPQVLQAHPEVGALNEDRFDVRKGRQIQGRDIGHAQGIRGVPGLGYHLLQQVELVERVS